MHTPARTRLTRTAAAALAVILLVAAALRFIGLNWDQGQHLHPDERFVTSVASAIKFPPLDQYFDSQRSTYNPNALPGTAYVYGTLPLYVTRFVGEIVQNVATAVIPSDTAADGLRRLRNAASYDGIYLVGRALSGLYDLLTIVLIFLIARRLTDTRVALVASILAAFTALQIQAAHFFTMETAVTFFMMLALYFAVRAAESGALLDWSVMGIATGLGMASKVTAGLLGLIFVVAAGLLWYRAGIGLYPTRRHLIKEDVVTGLFVSGALAFATFRLTQPYTFAGPGIFNLTPDARWLEVFTGFQRIGTGEGDVPFIQSWAGTQPYVWPLKQMFLWGMGPLFTIAAWLGVALAALQVARNPVRYHLHLIGLVWVVVNFAYWGLQFTKFMRYLLPIYPFLAIFAAIFLVATYQWVRYGDWSALLRWRPPDVLRRVIAFGVPAVVIGWTIFYSVAFAAIYTRPITRIEASAWIYDNIPRGAAIGTEHWDDRLPLGLPGRDAGAYRYLDFNNYDQETTDKRAKLISNLDQADYLIQSSNRLYGSIPKVPQKWPMTTRYYQALFAGELGFELQREFTSRPSLLGLELNDDDAEESFTVYEHPKVTIWKKSTAYNPQRTREILEGVPLDNVMRNLRAVNAGSNGLLLGPSLLEADRAGGTWAEIFDRGSLANQAPLLTWYLTVQLLGLLALPTTWFVLRRLGDAGYGLSKTIAVMGLAYIPWLLASFKLLPYTRFTILLAVLLMALSSGLVLWRHRESFLAGLVARKRVIFATEAIFTLMFGFWVIIRAWNPDLWHSAYGGEKPMDFAYLNAVIKTTYFPPYDPWLAAGQINYYYFGQVVVAALTKLTGILPWVAYNLAIPTIAALTAVNLASAVYNILIARLSGPPRREWWAIGGGVAAVLMGVILGNLAGFVQVVDWLGKVAKDASNPNAIPFVTGVSAAARGLASLLTSGGQGVPPFNFDFWGPTRVITTESTTPITEFPYFTFLYGDLHAHMIAMPFGLLVLGFALNLIRQPDWLGAFRRSPAEGMGDTPLVRQESEAHNLRPDSLRGESGSPPSPRRPWWFLQALVSEGPLTVLLAGVTIAVVRMTNSWDYPTYLGIIGVSMLMAEALRPDREWGRVVNRTILLGLCVFIAAELFARPYASNYTLFYTGVELSKNRTTLPHFLIISGSFLAILTLYLLFQLSALRRRIGWGFLGAVGTFSSTPSASGISADTAGAAPTWRVTPSLDRILVAAAAFSAFVAVLLWLAGMPVVGLCGLGITALALVAAMRRPAAGTLFMYLLAATSLAIMGGVEVIVLKGDIGRMNTVFKFYLQAWFFLSIACGALVALLIRRASGSPWLRKGSRWYLGIVVGVIVGLTALYPIFGTPSKLQHRFVHLPLSLDGMEFMRVAKYEDDVQGRRLDLMLPDDYRAINWMLDNIKGSPPIVEGIAPLYHWRSRVSIWTGLPTVIGWDWHQTQQRGDFAFMIEDRVKDVNKLYTDASSEVAMDILRKYRVEYVYVGGQEKAFYPEDGINKFERMVGTSLERVYQQGAVTIYHVVG